MSVLCQNSGDIGKSTPSALEISLNPQDFPRASPSGNLSGLGKSLGHQGWISQYLRSLDGGRTQSNLKYRIKFSQEIEFSKLSKLFEKFNLLANLSLFG